jgi:hypothetical protein
MEEAPALLRAVIRGGVKRRNEQFDLFIGKEDIEGEEKK